MSLDYDIGPFYKAVRDGDQARVDKLYRETMHNERSISGGDLFCTAALRVKNNSSTDLPFSNLVSQFDHVPLFPEYAAFGIIIAGAKNGMQGAKKVYCQVDRDFEPKEIGAFVLASTPYIEQSTPDCAAERIIDLRNYVEPQKLVERVLKQGIGVHDQGYIEDSEHALEPFFETVVSIDEKQINGLDFNRIFEASRRGSDRTYRLTKKYCKNLMEEGRYAAISI